MSRAPRSRALRPSGQGIGYSREFLEHLAHILVDAGHSPKKLAREFRTICHGLKEPTRSWNPADLTYLADLPHVLACWHDDPQFLDSKGDPMPLPVRSRNPSLSSLIARVCPAAGDPNAVIESLIRLRGIRRRGRLYVPTGRHLDYRQQSGRVHGLMALLGMLRTIRHNVSRPGSSTRILERVAVNPRFPVQALAMFHRWLKGFGAKFLWDADRNMRRREWDALSGPSIRLGVGVFAFEDPPVTGAHVRGSAPRRAAAARRRTRGRG